MTQGSPPIRYRTPHGPEAETEPGSRGRVLCNRLGIRLKREMDRAEYEALLAAQWPSGPMAGRSDGAPGGAARASLRLQRMRRQGKAHDVSECCCEGIPGGLRAVDPFLRRGDRTPTARFGERTMMAASFEAARALEDGRFPRVLLQQATAGARVADVPIALGQRFHWWYYTLPAGARKGNCQ